MTLQTTLMFLRYKSMRRRTFANRLKTKAPLPDYCKAMAPKTVPHWGSALDRLEQNVKSLSRKCSRFRLHKQPAVEGPPDDGPGQAGEPGYGEGAVVPYRLHGVHPRLDRKLVLL